MSRSFAPIIAVCLVVATQCVHSLPKFADQSESPSQNDQFDDFLKSIATQLPTGSQIDIPEVQLYGVFTVKGGKLKDLTSLKRVGDATAEVTSTGFRMKGSVAFSTLEADIGELDIDVPILPSIGHDSAVVSFGSNQIDLDIEFGQGNDKKCTLTVNQFQVAKLGDISISFGSFSIVNWIAAHLLPIGLNVFSSSLLSLFGGSVTTFAQSIFGSLNLCPK